MRPHFILAAGLAIALMASVSFASAGNLALDVQQIREQQSKLQIDVRTRKGAFKDMSEPERQDLLAKQDRVLALLRDKQDAMQLSEGDHLELVNTLEAIKGVVAKAEDERMVCKRIKSVGSNLPQRVCMTAAQQKEQQERARELMIRPSRCMDSSCTSSGG